MAPFRSWLSALPFAAAALILIDSGRSLPELGDPSQPAASHVSVRYIEKSQEETGASNMVTAVLADYRGYDTLGETVVIATAGLACLLVIGALGGRIEDPSGRAAMAGSFGSDVVDVTSRLLSPFLALFALYVLLHGHTSPGGGFQGGAILAAALILGRLVRGRRERPFLDPRRGMWLSALGVFLFLAVGLLSLTAGGNFLDYGALPLPIEGTGLREAGTLVIEIGVFIAVAASLLLIFESLTSGEGD